MTESIPRRIGKIKKLVKEYYLLEIGSLIEKHEDLLRLFNIRSSVHNDHPHKMKRVYISRRALKHYVESRKDELCKYHSDEKLLELICFGIDKIQETIINFDSYTYTPPNHYYIKDYASLGKPFLRIVIDSKEKHLEIKSIHFRKNNK